MSYEMVIVVFLMLVFCFFTQILTIKVMLCLFKANGEDIQPVKLFEKKPKKPTKTQKKDQERIENIMHNIEVYNGTGHGQIEVE